MAHFRIYVRLDDGTRRHRRDVTGGLGEACIETFKLADAMSASKAEPSSAPSECWVDLYDDDQLQISISLLSWVLAASGEPRPSAPRP